MSTKTSNKTKNKPYEHLFATLFLIISLIALVGSIYSWGDGFLFDQPKSQTLLLPAVDLVVTFPLALFTAILMFRGHELGSILGLVLVGCLLYGSVAVYVSLFIEATYPWELVVPPISGILLSISYIYWYHKHMNVA